MLGRCLWKFTSNPTFFSKKKLITLVTKNKKLNPIGKEKVLTQEYMEANDFHEEGLKEAYLTQPYLNEKGLH